MKCLPDTALPSTLNYTPLPNLINASLAVVMRRPMFISGCELFHTKNIPLLTFTNRVPFCLIATKIRLWINIIDYYFDPKDHGVIVAYVYPFWQTKLTLR